VEGAVLVSRGLNRLSQDEYWNWFDPGWGVVIFSVLRQLPGESEVQFTGCVEAGVWETHAGQRLADGAKGVSHRSASDRRAAGRQLTHAVSMSEELQGWDGVWAGT